MANGGGECLAMSMLVQDYGHEHGGVEAAAHAALAHHALAHGAARDEAHHGAGVQAADAALRGAALRGAARRGAARRGAARLGVAATADEALRAAARLAAARLVEIHVAAARLGAAQSGVARSVGPALDAAAAAMAERAGALVEAMTAVVPWTESKLGETDASNDGKLGATQGDTKNEGSGILTADVLAEAAKRAALARANAIKTLHASRDRACVFFLQGHCKLYSKCTNFHPSDEAEKQRWLDDYFATKCMLAERCTTPACLYSHPGQVRGQPPPGGTIEDAEQQDAQFKAEKAARDKLKVAQETAMSKNQSGEQSSHLSEAASHAAMKLGLNRPPPPPPPELLAVSGQDLQTPGEAADDPMEAEIRRMMQQQQQEYQAKQIVQGSATMKAGSPMPPSPLAREWNDKSSQEEGGCPTTPGSNMSRTTPLSKAAK
ncbi:unnamed protein product [Durusdinium trenchii]|uniref:C3H1-type domain-containing protein n=1 Tax=Durusdinium trenchii TaxID=1381693 RepID=A0ABP0SKZ0_9DINO